MSSGDYPLKVHDFIPRSASNGPGLRAVLWTQGCTLGCDGCFNPETHPPNGGFEVSVDEMVSRILPLAKTLEGMTISGGEPLQQARSVTALICRVRRRTDLSIIVFTGYAWHEIRRNRMIDGLLKHVDVMVCGRFDQSVPVHDHLSSSANQTVHLLSTRYALSDLDAVPDSEVIIGPAGVITISGTRPPRVSVASRVQM